MDKNQSGSTCSRYTKSISQICFMIGLFFAYLGGLLYLSWFHFSMTGVFSFSFAWIASIALVVYFAKCEWMLALGVAVMLGVLNIFVDLFLPSNFSLAALIMLIFMLAIAAGCLFFAEQQEGRPLNYKNLGCQLLWAPLYISAHLFCRMGMRKSAEPCCKSQCTPCEKTASKSKE